MVVRLQKTSFKHTLDFLTVDSLTVDVVTVDFIAKMMEVLSIRRDSDGEVTMYCDRFVGMVDFLR